MATVASAANELLALLARPMTLNELKAAYPVAHPLFIASFLSTACARGDVKYDRRTNRYSTVAPKAVSRG